MIPTDEFYDRHKTEQRELVGEGHVVVDGEIAETLPSQDRRSGVYIFEDPVSDIVAENLKGGKYTANELSPEFPINKEELDDLLRWMKYKPIDILTNHFGALRVVDTKGSAYVYTIEAVPFASRCLDPTLSGYLLDSKDECSASLPQISTERNSNFRRKYLDQAVSYWGIPKDEIASQLDDRTEFVSSTLGPLPIVENLPNVESVTERFASDPDSYRRKRHTVRGVKKSIKYHKARCRRNPSLGAFQAFSIYLMDISEYASVENDHQFRELVTQGSNILFRCLYGDLSPGKPTSWDTFEVNINQELEGFDRRVVDIVEQQPTSNSQLADRWGFSDGKDVWGHLQSSRLGQYTARNSSGFICSTESARQHIQLLEEDSEVSINKSPPRVSIKRDVSLSVSDKQEEDDNSGFDWSKK
jgi:hypothetical protein